MPVRVLRNDIEQGRLVAIPSRAAPWSARWASSTAAGRRSTRPRGRPGIVAAGSGAGASAGQPPRSRRTADVRKAEAAVHQALSRRSNSTAAAARPMSRKRWAELIEGMDETRQDAIFGVTAARRWPQRNGGWKLVLRSLTPGKRISTRSLHRFGGRDGPAAPT